MKFLSIIINLAIFISTLMIVVMYFRSDGHWNMERGRKAFRFFTCQSNVLCGIAAFFMVIARLTDTLPFAVWLLKYLGTVTVTVTMMTVLLFLGPTMGGYKELLAKENLYMHLIGPLLAIISFCFLERGHMSVGMAALGVIPVVCYECLYLYKVICAPEEKRWRDFYGFNKNGKWQISFAAMAVGTLIICMILRVLG